MCTDIKSLKLQNAENAYSIFNRVTFDEHDKSLFYCQFLARYFKGSSIVPLTDYRNSKTYKELASLEEVFTNSDKNFFIDLRRSKRYTNELGKLS